LSTKPPAWWFYKKGEIENEKMLLAFTAVALATAGKSAAQIVPSNALSGFYILEASGFQANDFSAGTPNTVHTGEVAVLGVLQFDGLGHFTGTLNFTSSDSGGAASNPDQAACSEQLTGTDGAFTITPSTTTFGLDAGPATGTMSITFNSSSKTSAGSISFNAVIANGGKKILLLQSDASISKLTICGEPISTLGLKGALSKTYLGNIL
jgi:hypothetical protein